MCNVLCYNNRVKDVYVCGSQAGSEDYIDEVRSSSTHSAKSSKHKSSHSQHEEYRSVLLNSIPLPTTGGHVTGKPTNASPTPTVQVGPFCFVRRLRFNAINASPPEDPLYWSTE